jgi:hypothetical protein
VLVFGRTKLILNLWKGGFMFEFITIERTRCYGICPVYKARIQKDGTVIFEGDHFVKKIGTHSWVLPPEALQKLDRAIKRFDYFGIVNQGIGTMVTCNPSCITSVKMQDGKCRRIDNNYGFRGQYPKKLEAFENRLDKIAGIADLFETI